MPAQVRFTTLQLSSLDVPAVEVTGGTDGPRLTILAGVHGCEYTSMAAVREFVRHVNPERIAGRITAVPILNLPAFTARTPFVVPDDGKNLNRCFPGDPAGTLADRLAYAAYTQLIEPADYLLDLHAGDMVEALEPFALYEASTVEDTARGMAEAYGLGYVVRQQAGADRPVAGSTSTAAAAAGIPAIIAEAGGRGLLERNAVETHLRGIHNVLTHLGMFIGGQASAEQPRPRHFERFLWLHTAHDGWWEPAVEVGTEMRAGDLIGTVSSLLGEVLEKVTAPADGVPLFLTSSPAVRRDGLLVGLGSD